MIGKKSDIVTDNNLTDTNLDLMRLIKNFITLISSVTTTIEYNFSEKTYHLCIMKQEEFDVFIISLSLLIVIISDLIKSQ
jgi:hypothetical protein